MQRLRKGSVGVPACEFRQRLAAGRRGARYPFNSQAGRLRYGRPLRLHPPELLLNKAFAWFF
jgi:hypothetical protein